MPLPARIPQRITLSEKKTPPKYKRVLISPLGITRKLDVFIVYARPSRISIEPETDTKEGKRKVSKVRVGTLGSLP